MIFNSHIYCDNCTNTTIYVKILYAYLLKTSPILCETNIKVNFHSQKIENR